MTPGIVEKVEQGEVRNDPPIAGMTNYFFNIRCVDRGQDGCGPDPDPVIEEGVESRLHFSHVFLAPQTRMNFGRPVIGKMHDVGRAQFFKPLRNPVAVSGDADKESQGTGVLQDVSQVLTEHRLPAGELKTTCPGHPHFIEDPEQVLRLPDVFLGETIETAVATAVVAPVGEANVDADGNSVGLPEMHSAHCPTELDQIWCVHPSTNKFVIRDPYSVIRRPRSLFRDP
jgi:hypothetical protein